MNKKVLGLFFASLLMFAFGSCKPKQSNYKSVYEAAKEREMETTTTVAPEETVYEPVSRPPVAPTTDVSTATVRKEKVTPVHESDASGLKAYSVVVAAIGMKSSAEALKEKIAKDGYSPILVQNEHGMYRVIISSFDSKDQAVNSRDTILASYLQKGSHETLRVKYGIPFNDWWILLREY